MQVSNIFNLISSDENALSKSLAFILHYNKNVLREFLKTIDLKYLSEVGLENTKIMVQVTSEAQKGITDLEIECNFEDRNPFFKIFTSFVDVNFT